MSTDQTDRELLELAAKAAGISGLYDEKWGGFLVPVTVFEPNDGCEFWNPLTDDGDALRLAVKLGFSVITEPFFVRIHGMNGALLVREEVVLDGYAATRRAIVRAAAEIGLGIAQQVGSDLPEDNYYKTQAEAEEVGRAASEIGKATQ